MATNYLKKKKMFAIMKDIFDIDFKMIDTEYNFYRGSEWLRYTRGSRFYEIYATNGGVFLSSECKEYDWDAEKYVNVNYKVWNGFGRCTYPIAEKVGV